MFVSEACNKAWSIKILVQRMGDGGYSVDAIMMTVLVNCSTHLSTRDSCISLMAAIQPRRTRGTTSQNSDSKNLCCPAPHRGNNCL
jgi:hypothetical protein